MGFWSDLKDRINTRPAPVPPSDPPPVRREPPMEDPTFKPVFDIKVALKSLEDGIDAVFSGKKKTKIPQPHPCGGCGGIVWA